jgi:hypothetical protein
VLHGQSRPPSASEACFDSTEKVDSAFAVAQAIQALRHSVGSTDSLKVADFLKVTNYQVISEILDARTINGTFVSLVPADPRMRGGGALVWVDGETFCAVVLRLYQ